MGNHTALLLSPFPPSATMTTFQRAGKWEGSFRTFSSWRLALGEVIPWKSMEYKISSLGNTADSFQYILTTTKAHLARPPHLTMSTLPSLLLVVLASSAAVLAAGGELKHIHLYMHETFSGPNATEGGIVSSPFGANSTFGQVAVFDNELRAGRDRASPLVARYQGIMVGTGHNSPGYLTVATVVFTAGEYNGSALSVEGPVLSFAATAERSIVGGTGRFRLARGYYLLKLLGSTSPVTAVSELDFFVLMYGGH